MGKKILPEFKVYQKQKIAFIGGEKMKLGNKENKILPNEILEQLQRALLRGILSSKKGISVSKAASIIIEEYKRIHKGNSEIGMDQAVEIRNGMIKDGVIVLESEFVEVKNGKFKPLSILS